MRRTTLMQNFHLAPLFDLTLTFTYKLYKAYTYMLPSLSLGGILVKFGFAAVTIPVSVADKASSDGFVLWPDLDPICDILKKIDKISFKNTR